MRAFVLVFEALAALSAEHRQRIHLSFVGGGPDEARLKRIVAKRALTDIVTFCGRMSRTATLDAMSRAHLLVFPSLRDSGSSSIAEAMALGLPVLALDLAGPGDMARGAGFLVTCHHAIADGDENPRDSGHSDRRSSAALRGQREGLATRAGPVRLEQASRGLRDACATRR